MKLKKREEVKRKKEGNEKKYAELKGKKEEKESGNCS
jgi:hypothetical protein